MNQPNQTPQDHPQTDQVPPNTTSNTVRLITALIGLVLVCSFVFGLSYSISTGFAGFEGGLPFAVITIIVMLMVLYDVWEDCIRKRR